MKRIGFVGTVVMAAGLIDVPTLAAGAQPVSASPLVTEEWIKANAIAFRTPEAGQGFDDLTGLREIVGDARIVSLGEPTHGTREVFQMKHRLLEFLVEEMGFSIFSIEANMPEAYALNDYVIDGKGDPKELIAGMYFWTWRTEEVLAMVEWMRTWNEEHPPEAGRPPLQFTGFDMQTPHVAWKIADDFVAAHAPDIRPLSAPLLGDLNDVLALARGGGPGPDRGAATGTFPLEDARGKSVTVSCWIRTEGVTGFADLFWRSDRGDAAGAQAGLRENAISGTTDWTRHEFTVQVPDDASNLAFGFSLDGQGVAWFDDVEISIEGVRYEDPDAFSFDFENDAVRYLSGGSREYRLTRTEEKPHGGRKCLELRRRPESELAAVDPVAIEARAEELVAALEARREALVKEAGAKGTDWAIQNARVVAQAARMYAHNDDGFNIRDESMAANVRWILDQNPGQRIVLWAHNGHVSRSGYMSMRSMGSFLAATHDKEMVVFGFATGAGTYTAVPMGGNAPTSSNILARSPDGSVERILRDSGVSRAILDIRGTSATDPGGAWAATPRPMRSVGAVATEEQFYPCVPNQMFDVLVWDERTNASRPLRE